MNNIKIKNEMIEYIPEYKVYTQKLLVFLLSKINKKDLLQNVEGKNGLILEVSKKELFSIFSHLESRKRRKAFYDSKEALHNIIKIRTDESYVETSFLSTTDEKKRSDQIFFYIPFHVIHAIADKEGNYFKLDFTLFTKFRKKYSIILYQILHRHAFKWGVKISPGEFNSIFGTNMLPAHIKAYILKIREEFSIIGSDIDFTFNIIKEGNKISYFDFNIFETGKMLEHTAKKEEVEVLQLYTNYLGDTSKERGLKITTYINLLSNYQAEYLYYTLRNKRKEIDQNLIVKIESVCLGAKYENYFKVVCALVLIVSYSKISKTIDLCAIEIQKGKINDNIAFVLSRLNALVKEENLTKNK